MSDPKKLDFNLLQALRSFEESGAQHDASAGISVSLRFKGDLAAIEALGFETMAVYGNEARGIVWFKDIPALVEHPGVLWIAAGNDREIEVDTAVRDIRARASAPGTIGSGGDGLWHKEETTDAALTKVADATGAGVIVAVIDTGIDHTHPAFMSQLTPTKKTRILRIWDQGLVATVPADSPSPSLLESDPLTYGVEYDDTEIDAAINGGPALMHRDCNGHGTHVAAIAAGGVRFPAGGDAKKVGVAPEADIIAVKLLDVPEKINYGTSGAVGPAVGSGQRFRDAVLYCLRTAHALGKPVVINMSFGSSFEPGDGLDEEARWIDGRLDPAQAADGGLLQFPTGAIVVKSSGNSGATGPPFDTSARRQTAKFTIPAGGLIVPIELKDSRGGLDEKWKNCGRNTHAPWVGVIFWYRRATPATAVKFAVKLPHQTAFNADQEVGDTFETSFRVNPPFPFTTVLHPPTTTRHTVRLEHEDNPLVAHPAGTVHRQRVMMLLRPKQIGSDVLYLPGIYEVRITAPAGTEVFAMCLRHGWARHKGVTCEIADRMQDVMAPVPAEVTAGLTADSSAVDTLGQHVVTVAAYNDTDGASVHVDHHAIADFSSRGPLRDFSDPPGSLSPIAIKPDIAGPGVNIHAAESCETEPPPILPRTAAWISGIRFIPKDGTSMSAPLVAGVVALMLDKKPDLNATEALTLLKTGATGRPGARPAAPPDPPQTVTNAYGSGMVDALASHLATP
ncbi:MAG: hypothetical protein CL608_28775 [Anaerolineaceae bacterium]|nr:hypothetical protein [Anaerolineaceae bacterium]